MVKNAKKSNIEKMIINDSDDLRDIQINGDDLIRLIRGRNANELFRRVKRNEDISDLMERGVRPDPRDENGATPLMYALDFYSCNEGIGRGKPGMGSIPNAEQLIAAGADINAKDNSGKSVLDYAFDNKYPVQGVHLLIRNGADVRTPDVNGVTPLMKAIEMSDRWHENNTSYQREGQAARECVAMIAVQNMDVLNPRSPNYSPEQAQALREWAARDPRNQQALSDAMLGNIPRQRPIPVQRRNPINRGNNGNANGDNNGRIPPRTGTGRQRPNSGGVSIIDYVTEERTEPLSQNGGLSNTIRQYAQSADTANEMNARDLDVAKQR